MGGGAESAGVEAVTLRGLLCLPVALAAGGCALFDWRSARGPEANWQDAYLAREAQFTLIDGSVKTLSVPRDFGPAVCAYQAPCLAKSEIVSVRWYRQTGMSRAGEYSGQVAVAALLWPITVPYLIGALTYQPNPAPERAADWSFVPDSCGDREAGARVVIQYAAAAAQWAADNRWSLGWFCLSELARHEGIALPDPMRVELEALGRIRSAWDRARCVLAQEHVFRGISTSLSDRADPQRGPPGYFELVSSLLRDPRTWIYETNLAESCAHQGGVVEEASWAERKVWMRALHPFPPADAGEYVQ
jgi:hypothetical protein